MKKLIGFVILLILAGGGWWYYVKYGTPPEKPTINKAVVSRGNIIESVPSTGTLEALRRFDVGSQVSGVVMHIYHDYNDIVKKNDLLAEIDPSLLQVQVDIQNANIDRAKSDIASQEIQLEDQKRQFERNKALMDKGLLNLQQYEAADLAIKTRQASIDSAMKGLISTEANLQSALLNVKYTKIIAPADGVIVERKVDEGQTVQASMTSPSFFIMATPLDTLKLTANVDESEIGKIRTGMRVTFKVDSYGPKQFEGTVENVRLNATTTNNVVTYPVWISVPNANLELRPFMTANLNIIISTATDVLRVPNAATRFKPNNEIYLALGLTPPAAGGGRVVQPGTGPETSNAPNAGGPGGNRNRNGQGGQGMNAQAGAPGAAGAGAQAGQNANGGRPQNMTANNGNNGGNGGTGRGGNRTPGQGGQGQGGQGGNGQPRMQPSDFAKLTPAEQKAMMDRFAAQRGAGGGRGGGNGAQYGAGGRGAGGGQGGRGGNAGQRGANQTGPSKLSDAAAAGKTIDELWAPIIPHDNPGSVWKWDGKELKEVKLRTGVTDGAFIEVKSGDLNVGDEIVQSITVPASQRPATTGPNSNPLLGGQGQRPGQGMPGMGGAGGGGAAGGGARGGGGGGGGRGGN